MPHTGPLSNRNGCLQEDRHGILAFTAVHYTFRIKREAINVDSSRKQNDLL